MKFKRRQLSLKNAVGFELTIEPGIPFYEQLVDASTSFKQLMMGDDLYFDGPTYFTYVPSENSQDILVFTTIGNQLEIEEENTSGIFFQESLDLTTDFYYRHYNQEEPIPYEEIEKAISEAGFKLVNIFHAVLDLYGDYVVDLYCEVEREG
ncbi:hypothetical protein ACVRXQ_13270 [Streptococcus panodentis]|uniref:DUF5085 family protein n=1 Tax=Streptococcus panodentis TaxID=1581472 RepID=A0ABS5B0D3_9STRE|nr:hypothetical protein [Streptococcus panodentis]MBP2622285.1 hypothetical protein [Streptococcus panodentis]